MSMTANENRKGKTMPMASSYLDSFFLPMVSIIKTVNIPIRLAPMIRKGELKSWVIKNPRTIPKSTVWLMASVSIESFLRIRNTPKREQDKAVVININSVSNISPPYFPFLIAYTNDTKPIRLAAIIIDGPVENPL